MEILLIDSNMSYLDKLMTKKISDLDKAIQRLKIIPMAGHQFVILDAVRKSWWRLLVREN